MTHYIQGQWHESTGTPFESIDPSCGDVIWAGTEASSKTVNDAVSAARKAFSSWGFRPFEERIAIVKRFSDLLVEKRPELAKLIARDSGKTLWDATGEATAMANKIDISIKAYNDRTGHREAVNGTVLSRLSHRPHGVMAVFGPYNFPGHLPNGHIVPALIAGNTIVFKPSELTPAVADYTVRVWEEAGLPAGVLNLVQGGRATGEALIANADINGVLFTGSARTGLAISRALLDRPSVIQALELGGNNPLIVHEVENHEDAAVMTILSAFVSSGQRCTCARRLIVPEGHEGDRFVDALVSAMKGITVGAWSDEVESFMGPLVSAHAAENVLKAQEHLIANGGLALHTAQQMDRGPAYLTPALVDVTTVRDRPDEEVFGPMLQLIRVNSLDAAIEEANNTKYGLAAGLLSDDRSVYDAFYPRIRAGIVNWNQQITGAASTAPFGGIGWSGNHRPSAYYAADYCSFPVATMEQAQGQVKLAAMPLGLQLSEQGAS